MRALPLARAAALVLAVCLAGGGVALAQTGPDASRNPQDTTAPAGPADPDRHIEAVGQGAQDPARAEVLEGRTRDMRRCLDTLTARREALSEARVVCDTILSGVGE